jgi:hypothetical protein
MADTRLVPSYPVQISRVSTPSLVGHVIDDPGDDDEEQMGIAVRNAAIRQEIHTWLIDRTTRSLDRYDQHALEKITDLGQKALTVHQVFSGETDIERVVRSFALDTVLSAADSTKRIRAALAGNLGDTTDDDFKPKKRKQPEVIIQAGPAYRKATIKDIRKQKFVLDEG